MARISKRGRKGREEEKIYKAGIYARISSKSGDREKSSLEVQIAMAKKYAAEMNNKKIGEKIDIVRCYTDFGKTGTNFERPGFKKLIQDIEAGTINCIIVKDLSRLGRNYIESGNYIEKIFPHLGVRFIAVSDRVDTGNIKSASNEMAVEIKNLVNELYARDFSKKAKLQLRQRRNAGEYVGGMPPYGYIVEKVNHKRVLIPDADTVGIVVHIYKKYVETGSCSAVIKSLKEKKINPPDIYRKTGCVYNLEAGEEVKEWNRGAIWRILSSETYRGTLIQGKTEITARSEKNRRKKPEEMWVVTRDAHEAIVNSELFERAKEIRTGK